MGALVGFTTEAIFKMFGDEKVKFNAKTVKLQSYDFAG